VLRCGRQNPSRGVLQILPSANRESVRIDAAARRIRPDGFGRDALRSRELRVQFRAHDRRGDDALDADNDGLYTATYNGSSQICETLTVGQGVGTLAITDDDGNGWASYDIDCEVVLDR
jgi:hypothetical protein